MAILVEDLTPQVMIELWERTHYEFYRFLASGAGGELYDQEDLFWMSAPVRSLGFNTIGRARLTEATVKAKVDEVSARFNEMNRKYIWWVAPSDEPQTLLKKTLEKHGLQAFLTVPCMAGNLANFSEEPVVPDYLVMERVHDEETLRQWTGTITKTYGESTSFQDSYFQYELSLGVGESSPWQRFIGKVNGKAVTTMAYFRGEKAVGLYNLSTLPEYQGKGIGRAMLVERIHDVKSEGYTVGTFQASNYGYRMYQNMGFQTYFSMVGYL